MTWRILLSFLLLLTLTQCDRREARLGDHNELRHRQYMSPAKTAEEWIARLEKDEQQRSFQSSYEHLYPELPNEEVWDKLLKSLTAEEKKALGRNQLATSNFGPQKKQLFAALLKEDQETAQRISREIIALTPDSEWGREDQVQIILSLSLDPNEGLEWIKKNKPKLLTPDKSYTSSKREKDPWDKALAEGKVQQGIALLWEQDRKENKWKDRLSALNHLIRLAQVLNDDDLAKRASQRMTKLLMTGPAKKSSRSYGLYSARPWTNYLIDQEEWETLSAWVTLQKKRNEDQRWSSSQDDFDGLELLLSFHQKEEETFLKELKKYLAEHDLAQVLETLEYKTGSQGTPLATIALPTLLKNQEGDLAKNLALYLVAHNNSRDPFYQLLLDLDPALFRSYLPKLIAYDPFEERPLIWQAELALADHQLEKAKELIESAIALDPSDGDQGKESRMSCYHVLARIHEKEGNQKQADFFFEVVKSIREGEAADDYLYAGLITEATRLYREALGRFEDAYCLQSRLAMTLARNGKFEEAIPHFEKAFELMPVSFGPRESHCLGCEGIFSDQRVQPIAERMLTQFIMKDPANPRAPYLLGMVLEEMKDEEGAIKAYQKALELDPRYPNCATRLEDLLGKNPQHFAAHQKLIKQLLEIAPYWQLNQHYAKRTDLAQAWRDAAQVGPSPLDLPALVLKKKPLDIQYGSHYPSYSHRSGKILALDGWTQAELLQGNDLLDSIDDL